MKTKFRNHPSLLLEQTGTFWAVIFVIFVFHGDWKEWKSILGEIKNTGDATPIIAVLILLGVFLLYTIITAIRWSKTWITIDDTSITIAVSTINKSSNTIGLQNISNVTIQRNLFEMLIGTSKLKIDTDSRSTAESTDVEIILKKEQAHKLREHLMTACEHPVTAEDSGEPDVGMANTGKGETAKTAGSTEQAASTYNVYYDNKKVLTHCLYTAPITGILLTLGGFTAFVIFMFVQIIQKDLNLQSIGILLTESAVAGSTFILLFAGAVYSLIKDFFKYHHFRAQRIGNRIQMEFGLFKRNSYEIPVERINSIVIQKPLISRLTKRCFVDVINVGIGDEEEENTRLLLSIPDKYLAEVLHRLLPEFDDYFQEEAESDSIRQPRSIWWKHGFGSCKLLFVAIIAFAMLYRLPVYTLTIAAFYWIGIGTLIAFYFVGCYGSYRADRLHLHKSYLAVSSGIFALKIQFIRYQKIQYMEFNESPIEHLLHLQSGTFYILASVTDSMVSLPSFEKQKIQPLIPLFLEDAKQARE